MSVVAVIPAYNEGKTIGDVLRVVKEVNQIEEIIVVSDGSTDNTVEISKAMGARVIELKKNLGKGGALKAGIDEAEGEVILFLDADLIGLKKEHIIKLIKPVIENEADMTVGIFAKGRIVTDIAQKIAPFLSGQRAVSKKVIEDMSNLEVARYGVEVALTKYVENSNLKVKNIVLEDLTHVMKEEKLGLIKGLTARMKMYIDIIKYMLKSAT